MARTVIQTPAALFFAAECARIPCPRDDRAAWGHVLAQLNAKPGRDLRGMIRMAEQYEQAEQAERAERAAKARAANPRTRAEAMLRDLFA